MKAFSLNKLLYTSGVTFFVLALSAFPVSYAQDGNNGKKTGFETGKHEGHLNENGNRKGHEKENNPWYDYYHDSGIDFDLVIHHHGLRPMTTFTITVNSLTKVQDLLIEVLGDSTTGFYLQECYQEQGLLMVTSDCTAGESVELLDDYQTLEAAGILNDPEVHLVYIQG